MERAGKWLILIFGLSLGGLNLHGQTVGIARPLDLTKEVKSLSLKSRSSIPSNTLALPLLNLDGKKSSKKLRWNKKKEGFASSIKLGANVASYVLLAEVALREGEVIIFSDQTNNTFSITSKENTKTQRSLSSALRGDISITYISGIEGQAPSFRVQEVYASPNQEAMELGFGAGFECQININCDEGRPYAKEKNGVMRIRMVAEEGIALCSGTLLNNTAEDGDPLVLTAFHCLHPANTDLTPLFDMWRFDFNYESFSCANPESEPGVVALQGATVIADWRETDMMLLRIEQEIPEDANAYFVGWDRRNDYNPIKTALIHQPAGDIKKITIDNDPVSPFDDDIAWNNASSTPPNTHFINDFDEGVYQPGSSGAGLFDDEGRVIGQLHGGPLSDEFCSIGIGYSGRLGISWDAGEGPTDRLSDWLDPAGTGAMKVDGIAANATEQVVQFKGKVLTPKGISIPKVRISLSGDKEASFLTGSDGRFVFDNLSTKKKYAIKFSKETGAANGLSVVDLISIQNHILGKKLITDDFGKLAADVNHDGKISSVDLVQMLNVMIGRSDKFTDSDSWRFEPNTLDLNGENVGAGVVDLSIIGYKVGDVNGSANPRN